MTENNNELIKQLQGAVVVKTKVEPKTKAVVTENNSSVLTTLWSNNKKKENIEEYSWLIYGDPKAGKSTLCSQFKNALILDTQNGYKNLDHTGLVIKDWKHFLLVCTEIAKGTEFKVVVIDLIDDLYHMCLDYITARQPAGWHPGDEEWGRGWSMIADEFTSKIGKLNRIPGISLVFVSHAKDKDIKTRDYKIVKTMPTFFSNRSAGFVMSIVDIVLYITSRGGDQVMVSRGSESLIAGDKTGLLEKEMTYGYETIEHLFQQRGDIKCASQN